ncbi:MAG: guanylate kinase [Myxococcota bacterium]|jgi:guanylate kinase
MSSIRPQILILSSPSGAGKTTLARKLRDRRPEFEVSISHTTRKPRKGEEHGREYYFVNNARFDVMLETHQFIEHAAVHTSRYGTAKTELTRIFAARHSVLLDIDYQGTRQVRWAYPKATTVFILPPSMTELARRLRGRKTDDEKEIQVRLANARKELENYDLYDFLIVNDDLDAAFADLDSVTRGAGTVRPQPTLLDVERLLSEEVCS